MPHSTSPRGISPFSFTTPVILSLLFGRTATSAAGWLLKVVGFTTTAAAQRVAYSDAFQMMRFPLSSCSAQLSIFLILTLLLLLLPSRFSRVRLCATPWTAATRLPGPWDSPGKNTGVGCHFLLQCVKVKSLSHVWLLATPWTAAYQAPPCMGFSRQEYWSGVPLPSPILTLTIYKYLK